MTTPEHQSADTVIDDGGPVYPCKVWQQVSEVDIDGEPVPTFADVDHYGIKLRDWFAGQSLVGMETWIPAGYGNLNSEDVLQARAEFAYRQADAMILARKGGRS